jgi:hypothetical protein
MSSYQELPLRVHAGVLAWLESEAQIINADLQTLGHPGNVTAADVAAVLLERGIATTLSRADTNQQEPLRERAVGE